MPSPPLIIQGQKQALPSSIVSFIRTELLVSSLLYTQHLQQNLYERSSEVGICWKNKKMDVHIIVNLFSC